MSEPPPGSDPNATLYAQLKRDVLDRVPHITTVEFVPDDIEATRLRATFDPDRLDSPTGPEPPTLVVTWYRRDPNDWFRVDYADPNTGFHVGWHQDDDHPEYGAAHVQVSTADVEDRWPVTFDHETPSLILWEIVDALLADVLPEYT